jgi:GDP/UDP-N,N'-diacetylbacillosamine 2-epimerase (hydrolysing)
MVLGDRYETLAVCIAAMNARIPIIHLYGGDTTEGAVDEAIRHSITKMSYLHFTSTEAYRKRVIQLGESPDRVFTVGAMGVENALRTAPMTKEELESSLGHTLGNKYAVGTFHPVTLEASSAEQQTEELLAAIAEFPDITFLFTKANADADGRVINKMLGEYAKEHSNVLLYDSLGMCLRLISETGRKEEYRVTQSLTVSRKGEALSMRLKRYVMIHLE